MPWVETHSASFTARHDSAAADQALALLDDLERFRADLDRRLPATPGDVAVVIHSHYALLAAAHPWLPLAQVAAAPASRRYFGGWFAAGEIHVLAPELLQRRASAAPGSSEALRLAPLHEYAHLVVGLNNADLPPPFTLRSFRSYLRWAWLCEGSATYLCGQHRHLRRAIARRLREGPTPALPPPTRDAPLLGGALFELLERVAGPEACVELAGSKLERTDPRQLLERAFDRPLPLVARDWRDHLDELAAADRR